MKPMGDGDGRCGDGKASGARPAAAKIAASPDSHDQRAHAVRCSRRSADKRKEGERHGLDRCHRSDAAQSAASVAAVELKRQAIAAGARTHDVGGDAAERQHAAAIDEEAEFDGQRRSARSAPSIASMSRGQRVGVEG